VRLRERWLQSFIGAASAGRGGVSPGKALRVALWPLLRWLLLVALTVVIFSPPGVLNRLLGLDLWSIGIVLIVFASILLVGTLLRRFTVPSLGTLVGGGGFAYLVYSLVALLPYTVDRLSPALQWLWANLPARYFAFLLKPAALEGALIALGASVIKAGTERLPLARPVRLGPLIRAAGVLVVGYALFRFCDRYTYIWEPLRELGWVFLGGFIGIALRELALYGERATHPLLSGLSRWVAGSLLRALLLGGFLVSYVRLVRPLMYEGVLYAPFIEWGLLLLVVGGVYAGARREIDRIYSEQLRELDWRVWRRHLQQVTVSRDREFSYASLIQRAFVEEGVKDGLIVYLAGVLTRNQVPEARIAQLLHPLVQYRDRDIPWLAFGWERRRVARKNREERERLLEGLLKTLEGTSPQVLQREEVNT
jgi:hypothetical protein